MKVSHLFAFSTALVSSLSWAADPLWKGTRYSLGMSGDFAESEQVKARVLSVNLGLRVNRSLAPDLNFHAHLIGNFENGTNKATGLTAEYEPNQAVNLFEGGLRYTPWSFVELNLGAIQQNQYASPLLVWNTAFAGGSQKISWGPLYLMAQQAIPNNNVLSRRIGGVDEGTPLFHIETLGADLKAKAFDLRLALSRFSYQDLSSQVALTSQDFGNSVTGANEAARFLYGFQGTNAAGALTGHYVGGWQTELSGQYLFNEKAPDGRNTGHLVEGGVGVNGWLIKVGSFRNESDTAPAFYNSRMLGHNNIEGMVTTLQSQGADFSFRLSFVSGSLIDQNVRQSDIDIINFFLVKNYEL